MSIPHHPCGVREPWRVVSGGITAPAGFRAGGVAAGLKASGAADLALVLAPPGAVCAGTFTRNRVRAACVDLCAEHLRQSSGGARAVVINAGQANACTGGLGRLDSERIAAALAEHLDVPVEQVQICSTGVIGQPIPMERLFTGLKTLLRQVDRGEAADTAAATAILTTDLVPKQLALEARLGGRCVRLGGMAKGSGMIHPDMATMLGFVTCDVHVDPALWQSMLTEAVEQSFNAVTVDGDTSTNDTVLGFAAGERLASAHLPLLKAGLEQLCVALACAVARDGEGATCLVQVEVKGATTDAEARTVARTICSSSLVKTAIHGRDPNWGRIVAAAGRAGVVIDTAALELWCGPHQLMHRGQPVTFDRAAASRYLQQCAAGAYLQDDCVRIRLTVGAGEGQGRAWGCDLSEQYIRINADYTT